MRHTNLSKVGFAALVVKLTGCAGDASPAGSLVVQQGPLSGPPVLVSIPLHSDESVALVPESAGAVQLTTGGQGGEHPVWSPDGEWIAYQQAGTTIALMRADGSEHRTLDVAGIPTDWGPKTGSC